MSHARRLCVAAVLCTILAIPAFSAAPQDPPVTLIGRVSDWQGCGLHEVKVEVRDRSDALVATGQTRADAQFEIAGLRPGVMTLRADLNGFQRSQESRWLQPGVNVWDTALPVGMDHGELSHGITGTVSDSRGDPVAEATVTLVDVFTTTRRAQVRTNAKGGYTLKTGYAGQYVIAAVAPTFRAASTTVEFPESDRATVDLRLQPRRSCPL